MNNCSCTAHKSLNELAICSIMSKTEIKQLFMHLYKLALYRNIILKCGYSIKTVDVCLPLNRALGGFLLYLHCFCLWSAQHCEISFVSVCVFCRPTSVFVCFRRLVFSCTTWFLFLFYIVSRFFVFVLVSC